MKSPKIDILILVSRKSMENPQKKCMAVPQMFSSDFPSTFEVHSPRNSRGKSIASLITL